ncbi:helix-turn-helix transcriptional regulator [Arenimonas composti]|uniref:helix-turn-helix transcriptional regulator n=1 Tax=Arenimonas composti TaxID=370776 RepID=UPI0003FCCEEE|nr:WYL domain-containing protein [Arenimonas composti]
MLELLKRIPRTGWTSAPELRKHLEAAGMKRDVRSIQRTLDQLQDLLQLERDTRSRPHGYRFKRDADFFAAPKLGAQESLLLHLAWRQLHPLLPPSLKDSLSALFEQARINLGAKPGSREREWLSKVRVVSRAQHLLPPPVDPEVFEAVCHALYDNKLLEVDYRNAVGEQWQAQVMPLGLVQLEPALYLVCRFDGHDDERLLALHRMRVARPTTLGFQRPAGFDLDRCHDEGLFAFGRGRMVRLSFTIDKEAGAHLLEMRLSDDQTVKDLGDSYRIAATVVDTWVLQWWLHGFGKRITSVIRRPISKVIDESDSP